MSMQSLLDADLGFPSFTGEESAEAKCDKILNYLYMLLENLRYTLGNLDAENFNDEGLEDIGKIISEPILTQIKGENGSIADLYLTAEALNVRIGIAEDEIEQQYSQIYADMNSIALSVTNYGSYSYIRLTGNGIIAQSHRIVFSGYVTFSDLEESGTTTINGDNITTGTITGVDFVSQNNYDDISGRFLCRFNDYDVGAIYVGTDDSGNPSLFIDAAYDSWRDYYGKAQYASLKLYSGAGMSLSSSKNIYIASDNDYEITIRAAGELNLQASSYENIKVGTTSKMRTLKSYIQGVVNGTL